MNKYVAEWSFRKNCLNIYDAMGFFTGMPGKPVYSYSEDGFSNASGKIDFTDVLERDQFYDEITRDSLIYVKGTYFNNLLMCSGKPRYTSLFQTLVIAYEQVGLILDDSQIDAIECVFVGFKSFWLDNQKRKFYEGKLLSFIVEEISTF